MKGDSGIIDHFVEGIVSGSGHSVTGEDGCKTLEIVLAGINAANLKQTVAMGKPEDIKTKAETHPEKLSGNPVCLMAYGIFMVFKAKKIQVYRNIQAVQNTFAVNEKKWRDRA